MQQLLQYKVQRLSIMTSNSAIVRYTVMRVHYSTHSNKSWLFFKHDYQMHFHTLTYAKQNITFGNQGNYLAAVGIIFEVLYTI